MTDALRAYVEKVAGWTMLEDEYNAETPEGEMLRDQYDDIDDYRSDIDDDRLLSDFADLQGLIEEARELVSSLPPDPADSADAAPAAPQTPATPRTEFLCVGTYDDGDRFAESVEAFDASEAEVIAQANWPSVTWAGFVALRNGVMTVEG